MEHYKISKLLNDSTVSKFATKILVEVNDLSSGKYSINKNISFKTSILRSDLCDYSFAYIVVKGRINVKTTANMDIDQKHSAFKNNATFRSCISKIYSTLIYNAEGLDVVKPMYNLLEYSQNYSMTSGRLWNYYRDEIDDVDDNASDGKTLKYKTKIIGKKEERPARPSQPDPDQPPQPTKPTILSLNTEVTIPLKYLSNFLRSLDLP